jgi:hypothetical protein
VHLLPVQSKSSFKVDVALVPVGCRTKEGW